MGTTIDHVGVPARDPEGAAAFLAEVLGLDAAVPDGPDGDMFTLRVGESASLVFSSSLPPQPTTSRSGSARRSSRASSTGSAPVQFPSATIPRTSGTA